MIINSGFNHYWGLLSIGKKKGWLSIVFLFIQYLLSLKAYSWHFPIIVYLGGYGRLIFDL